MDGALADVLVCAIASHHIHLCPDELEAPPAPLLLVHPQKTVKGGHPPPPLPHIHLLRHVDVEL
jgi:hypothetical protein